MKFHSYEWWHGCDPIIISYCSQQGKLQLCLEQLELVLIVDVAQCHCKCGNSPGVNELTSFSLFILINGWKRMTSVSYVGIQCIVSAIELMQTGNKPWCCKPQLLFINVGLSHCIYWIMNLDGVIGSLGQAFQAEVMKRGPKFYIYTWGLKPGEGGGTPKILTQVCTSSLRNRTLRKLTPKSRSSLGQIFEIIPFTRENSSSYSTA